MRSLLPEKYEVAKADLMLELEQVDTCAVTTNFWTSASMEGYVMITCHYLVSSWELKSCVLATYQVKMWHTAKNVAAEFKKVANDWNITNKISCIVTNSAANMTAAARLTGWVHVPCFAHTLNLIIQEVTERDKGLNDVCTKTFSIVTYFKQSAIAKDMLGEIQLQIGEVEKKRCHNEMEFVVLNI